MARRKKNQMDILDIFIGVTSLLVTLITLMLTLFIKLICFIYDVITIYQSGYKKKSGNGFFKTYFNKGHMGEFRLYRKLKRLMKAEDTIYTNIYLPGLNTTHTELDLLVVSKKGLIVYEVKNYGGYIYGSKQDTHWTQVLNYFSKHKFYNPLRQNYAHHKALENYLAIPFESVYPVVSFSNRSRLSKIKVDDTARVMQTKDTIKYTKDILTHGSDIFSDDMLSEIKSRLELAILKDQSTKTNHVNEVIQLIKKWWSKGGEP